MVLKRRAVVVLEFMVTLVALSGASSGAVHNVGGSSGWTNIGIDALFYKKWSLVNTFHAGDTIVFEYNKQYHNVIEVMSFYDFYFCNNSSPAATYSSGSDFITLNRPGHVYFTCGSPGHCQTGQKLHIFVHPEPSTGPIGSPIPAPGPSPSPTLIAAPSPF